MRPVASHVMFVFLMAVIVSVAFFPPPWISSKFLIKFPWTDQRGVTVASVVAHVNTTTSLRLPLMEDGFSENSFKDALLTDAGKKVYGTCIKLYIANYITLLNSTYRY